MSAVSGVTQAMLGKEGADVQAEAAKYAANVQLLMYQDTQARLLPSLMIQQNREGMAYDRFKDLNAMILAGPGEFTESERYKFVKGQGEEAIHRAAVGGLGAGSGTIDNLVRFNQGLASTERSNWLGEYQQRLGNLASISQGEGVANVQGLLANAGQNAATGIGNAAGNAAAAQAGYLGNVSNIIGQNANMVSQIGASSLNKYLANTPQTFSGGAGVNIVQGSAAGKLP